MAIIQGPISIAVVQSFRGTIDFYYDHGQAIARAWPRRPKQPHSVGQQKHWAHLRRMHAWIKQNPRSWYNQIGITSSSPTQSLDDRARFIAWRATEVDIPPPMPDITRMTIEKIPNTGHMRIIAQIGKGEYIDYSHFSIACVDARPHAGILRWYPFAEAGGRWGGQRTLCRPPVSGGIQPMLSGAVASDRIIWATFNMNFDAVLAWPVYEELPHFFTGAAWLTGAPSYPLETPDESTPLRLPRSRSHATAYRPWGDFVKCWKNKD